MNSLPFNRKRSHDKDYVSVLSLGFRPLHGGKIAVFFFLSSINLKKLIIIHQLQRDRPGPLGQDSEQFPNHGQKEKETRTHG